MVPDLRGVAPRPSTACCSAGDALMLYTDGLVEAPGRDIDAGTDRLLGEAERILSAGFAAAARVAWWATCRAPATAPTTARWS